MQFNSFIFILAFLPAVIVGYFLLNKIHIIAGKLFLIAAGAVFYVYAGMDTAIVFGASLAVNYLLALAISRAKKHAKTVLVLAILANLGYLFFYKYLTFFLSGIDNTFSADLSARSVIIPLGISFITFQQIMYQVNVFKQEIGCRLIDYLSYILFFPKLLMGPLAEPKFLIDQFNDPERKRVDWHNIACGLKSFSFGLFKKMVLANTFSLAVSWGYSNLDKATSMDWILVMLCYTFEIYFDFSGWIDMADGVSLMLNIELPPNFNSPFKATSIADFWRRWHISLLKFFTHYIYFPLGGSRKGNIRTYLNIFIVFIISGIWHGAAWTFILWGFCHGLLCVVERIFKKKLENLFVVVRWAYTFIACMILRILYCSESVGQFVLIMKKIAGFQDMSVSAGLIKKFVLPEQDMIFHVLHLEALNGKIRGLGMVFFLLGAFVICLIPENNYNNLKKNSWFSWIFAAIAFIWGFLCLSAESVFVYF